MNRRRVPALALLVSIYVSAGMAGAQTTRPTQLTTPNEPAPTIELVQYGRSCSCPNIQCTDSNGKAGQMVQGCAVSCAEGQTASCSCGTCSSYAGTASLSSCTCH
jgi:hypothetical protein